VRDVAEAVLQMLASGQRGALATVVRASGSTPQQPGARLALMPDGRLIGTVGGGAIEQAVVEALGDVLRTGQSQVLVRELGHDLGMCCGGRMEVFVEAIEAIPRLVLFGAGHIAVPTAALARSVGFAVHVIDDREELVTPERFPGCELTQRDASSMLKRTRLGERDYVLIVTHDHGLDEELLALALQQSSAYIGLVGSKRKVFRLLQRISARRGPQDLSRVFAPVGLDLGAQTPAEIAVSIVAELIAVRNGKSVPHMRAVEDVRLLRLLENPEDAVEESDDAAPSGGAALPPAAATPRVAAVPPAAVSDPPTAKLGLEALAERVHRDLSLLNYPQREWLTPRKTGGGSPIYDALIVGAGQSGLACAFGLMRERVKNLLIVDQNPLDRAGPWLNFARMKTLRTPKYLTGPDLGIPNLTPRAWYEAQHGDGSWETLGLIPKETWAEYLAWYRKTLSIPVQPDTAVGALTWDENERAFRVPCTGASGAQTLWARRVVLATGIDGSGAWQVPRMISENLPTSLYAHTRWDIDFEALRGKRIAVLGAGASAFDNASTALDHGASTVHMFFRRPSLVNVNSYRWAEFVGFLRHMGDLPDPDKWRFISQILRMGQLPPTDTYKRATAHPGFEIKAGTGWTSVAAKGDTVLIGTKAGTLEYDFVIVGTGFVTDLSTRPELKAFEASIARWSDRYTPPAEDQNDELSRHPYLGAHFEFTERTPGEAPYLKHLYNYTFGGLLSLGFGGASISGMKYSVPRLVSGITGSYFIEDRNHYYDTLCNFAEREF
jgi:xanthine/CO dehydrogenase XdhC/CoxF family maturation factor/cation diffusion facilitator CzcD-associated flavoprotein CzcO